MHHDNANQEYRPTFVYSRRKRGALRRLTPAGWLAVFVTVAVVVFGIAGVVRSLAVRAEGWSTASTIPTRAALAVTGAKSAPALPEAPVEAASPGADAHTPTPEPSPTPPGGVWWADRMTPPALSGATADGALVPPEAVQEEIKAAWEMYFASLVAPLSEVIALTEAEWVERCAMTPAFAARLEQSGLRIDAEKALATGRILTVQSDRVNLRAGPGTNYDAVGTAAAGTQLYLLEERTGSDGKTWYRAWLIDEAREVWIASWLVQVKDNAWSYPEYRTRAFAFDCAPDGLSCTLTVTMTDGGTGYYNLRTGEQGFSLDSSMPYPPEGIRIFARMVYDTERERWLCDGIGWEKLTTGAGS
ncbi:MAG: hypothetical protein Kow00120_19140 [Anaerolineae bacterium]